MSLQWKPQQKADSYWRQAGPHVLYHGTANKSKRHKFPFSSVKAELPPTCGNNKEKILLSVAPKNMLAEALVGSLRKKKKGCVGVRESRICFSSPRKGVSFLQHKSHPPLALLLFNCSPTNLQFSRHQWACSIQRESPCFCIPPYRKTKTSTRRERTCSVSSLHCHPIRFCFFGWTYNGKYILVHPDYKAPPTIPQTYNNPPPKLTPTAQQVPGGVQIWVVNSPRKAMVSHCGHPDLNSFIKF